jgi:hypothetical protein
VILQEEEIKAAIIAGRTLDQLNLRAGDEIMVDEKVVARKGTISVLAVLSLAMGIVYMTQRIFKY